MPMRMPDCSPLRWIVIAVISMGAFMNLDQSAQAEPTPANAKTGLIPRKVLFDNPDKAGPQISPNGKYLSYLAPVNGVLNVWVGPIDKPEEAKPITKDKKRGIRAYFWTYTNDHILYI